MASRFSRRLRPASLRLANLQQTPASKQATKKIVVRTITILPLERRLPTPAPEPELRSDRRPLQLRRARSGDRSRELRHYRAATDPAPPPNRWPDSANLSCGSPCRRTKL